MNDFKLTDAGFLREQQGSFFTSPPPYSPKLDEHDIVIRADTGVRFQIIDLVPIMIEDILVSQQFNMVELDPRSTIYNFPYVIE
jgi:hypothetical protein